MAFNSTNETVMARHKLIVNLELSSYTRMAENSLSFTSDLPSGSAPLLSAAGSAVITRTTRDVTTASIVKSHGENLIENDIPIMTMGKGPVAIPEGIKKIAVSFSLPGSALNVILGLAGHMKTRLAISIAVEMMHENTMIVIFDSHLSITRAWLCSITGKSKEWVNRYIAVFHRVDDVEAETRRIIEVNDDVDREFIFIIDDGKSLIK
jgi:hypothetical protein